MWTVTGEETQGPPRPQCLAVLMANVYFSSKGYRIETFSWVDSRVEKRPSIKTFSKGPQWLDNKCYERKKKEFYKEPNKKLEAFYSINAKYYYKRSIHWDIIV